MNTPGETHEEQQKRIHEELEVMQGYEYYQHSLQLDADKQQTEVEREISRLQAMHAEMDTKEIENLRKWAPPAPNFQVLSPQQVQELGFWDAKNYKNKVAAYKEAREEWENSYIGEAFTSLRDKVEDRAELKRVRAEQLAARERKAEEQKDAREGKEGFALYGPIASTPEAMEAALEKMDDEENRRIERRLSEEEVNMALTAVGPTLRANAITGLTAFVNEAYVYVNRYLRKKQIVKGFETFSGVGYAKLTQAVKKTLANASISRDLVVRRGVKGLDSLSYMLDGGKSKNLSAAEMAAAMRSKLAAGNVILSDKGIVSTSICSDAGKPAEPELRDDGKMVPGIEYVILVKKGTKALDISGTSLMNKDWSDQELLIAPGTQFRVVRAFFNDGEDKVQEGDGKDPGMIRKGGRGNWKIYLETIPGTGADPDE